LQFTGENKLENEEKIKEFLTKIPDNLILSEAARRQVRRRKPENAGPKLMLRQCEFCEQFFGAREMRLHLPEAHPGRKSQYVRRNTNDETPHQCPYCPEIMGARKLRIHLAEKHPNGNKGK
jgi:hypothetical protein